MITFLWRDVLEALSILYVNLKLSTGWINQETHVLYST